MEYTAFPGHGGLHRTILNLVAKMPEEIINQIIQVRPTFEFSPDERYKLWEKVDPKRYFSKLPSFSVFPIEKFIRFRYIYNLHVFGVPLYFSANS